MTLFLKCDSDRVAWWQFELARGLPALEVRAWPEIGAREDIEIALVWEPPRGLLGTLPNLKLIISIGAGVDHLFNDPELPKHVPIVRVIDRELTQRMTEYVVLHVLRHHRRQPEIEAHQREKKWCSVNTPAASGRPVGIMGLGELGREAACKLNALGFPIFGWSRTPKELDQIECFHGSSGLREFLAKIQILVCLLPLTPETVGILSRWLFEQLPTGASLVNAARGAHLVEVDLLSALDSGRLSHATLDVFATEPLPEKHPFWHHPKITITPHNASMSNPSSVANLVVENIQRSLAGAKLLHQVDPARGY